MNPTYKLPARPSRTARVGARSNTRAREFKVRRRRAPQGGTPKIQPAAQPRKQRSQTQNKVRQRAPSHSIKTCHNSLARIPRGSHEPRESGPGARTLASNLWQTL